MLYNFYIINQMYFYVNFNFGISKIFLPCESYVIFSLKRIPFFHPAYTYFHFYDVFVAVFNILTHKL